MSIPAKAISFWRATPFFSDKSREKWGRICSPFAAVGKVTLPAGQDIPHRAGVQKDPSLRSG
jgi:hypothetical protein